MFGVGQEADIRGVGKPLGTNMAVQPCQVCGVPTEDIGREEIIMLLVCLNISVILIVYAK